MIRKLLAIAAVASTGLLAAPKAEAGNIHASVTFQSGHASCGCAHYTKRYVRGYDCYRRPIFGYTRLAFTHGSSCRHRAVHRPTHIRPAHSYIRPATSYIRGRSHGRVYGPRIVISSRSYGNRGHAYDNRGRSYGQSRGSSCR